MESPEPLSWKTIFLSRNILALLNGFELPEGSITGTNYDQIFTELNQTNSALIDTLSLKKCSLDTFLSEVRPQNLLPVLN